MRLLEIIRRLFFSCTLEQFQKPSSYLFLGNLKKKVHLIKLIGPVTFVGDSIEEKRSLITFSVPFSGIDPMTLSTS